MARSVLITDGETRSALAVTRSLGRKGFRVMVTGRRKDCLASCSKFCVLGISVPDPVTAGAEYAEAIREIAIRENIHIILPMTEVSIYLLNGIREHLPPNVVLACATGEKMAAVSNKQALFRLAEKLHVPLPRTHYVSGPSDLASLVDKVAQYPVVVKPGFSKIRKGNGFLSCGVMYATSREELEHLYRTSVVLRHPSMIQERIVGPGTGLFSLYDGDKHLALFSHRRLREKPPSGGVSVVSESVPPDEGMVESAGRLLSAVGWRGVAMVEFKRDQRDGKAKLMEINGRFWGTLQLAIACGVDFPTLLVDHLQGNNPSGGANREYRIGHKLKWFFGTLDHLLIRLKNRDRTLNLPPGFPTKRQAVMDFLKIRERNASFDVFDPNDPRPFVFEVQSYMKQLFRDEP